jgi:hypothetical protein
MLVAPILEAPRRVASATNLAPALPRGRELYAGAFMFATGIECSYPVIASRGGGITRQDQLEKGGHYRHWREDLRLVAEELGLQYLRYGPPLHRVWLEPGRYDWSFTDETFGEMRRQGITPIADLCHFGVPD